MKALIALFGAALICLGQPTQVDWNTQVKNGPGFYSDASSTVTTLAQACATANTKHLTLTISRTWTLLADTACAAPAEFLAAGKIVTNSHVFTFSVMPTALPTQQIFDISGGGSVAFTGKKSPFPPQWWGAQADGTTDDSAAVQACLTAASGGTCFLQCAASGYNVGAATIAVAASTVLTMDVGCTFIKTTGNGGVRVASPIDQALAVHVKRGSQQWSTGADTTSVGLTIDCANSNGCGRVRAKVVAENYYTGMLVTTSAGDFIDSVFEYELYLTNKIADDWRPSGGHGTNQITHLSYEAKINQNCAPGVAVPGTKHTWQEVGSDNAHYWINPEHEDECVEHAIDSHGTNSQWVAMRCEGCLANSILLEADSSSLELPYLFSDSGVPLDVIQDLSGGKNGYCAILECYATGRVLRYNWYNGTDGTVAGQFSTTNPPQFTIGGKLLAAGAPGGGSLAGDNKLQMFTTTAGTKISYSLSNQGSANKPFLETILDDSASPAVLRFVTGSGGGIYPQICMGGNGTALDIFCMDPLNNRVRLGSTTSFRIPNLAAPATHSYFICIDENGTLSSRSTACPG